MSRDEQNEFYRNMSAEQKLKIAFAFMDFGNKLEQKENPQVILKPYSD